MKFILALLLTLPLTSSSFTPAAWLVSQPTAVRPSSSSALKAAQKRRRRKTAPPASPTAPSSDDDLPDFDDDDGYESGDGEWSGAVASSEPTLRTKTQPSSVVPIRRGPGLNPKLAEEVGGNVDGLDEEIILEAMRGRTGDKEWQPPRSIQDTISDRSLEKLMDFDRMIERDGGGAVVELPEFDDVISRRKRQDAMREGRVEDAAILIETSGMGKKAARDAERRALAMQRVREEAEVQKSPFADLNILKLLENGAWAGIGLLVLWEFYINSPLFERAAPLIPVVYDTVPPGM
ncbi:hypothetical protein ACHAW5_002382 [Stephanodiscus triporus]|uniref:Uncharacterized protein n=1 Tax=Stephanodiscus triporus TaxID=2934178 RepID=A0ABD3NVB2_9STRA